MSKKSFFSKLTKKQLYLFVLAGISIFLLFLTLWYVTRMKIQSGLLTLEETDRQKFILAFSTIGTTVGFIVAIIPSVKIFQIDIEAMKTKEKNKNPSSSGIFKKTGAKKTDSEESDSKKIDSEKSDS